MNHMNKQFAPISHAAIAVLVGLTAFALPVEALAQSASQPQHAQASLLPLSGRTGDRGSVTAISTPIAGTTNSVTTINPSVQVQGPYTGSSTSTTAMPFAGKLSLSDAIQRGLSYNLGATQLNRAVRQAQ